LKYNQQTIGSDAQLAFGEIFQGVHFSPGICGSASESLDFYGAMQMLLLSLLLR